MTKRRKPVSLLRRSERLLTSVRKAIYSNWLSSWGLIRFGAELRKCVRLSTSWESKLDPDTSRRAGPVLHSEPRLSAKARRSRAAGIGPGGTEEGALLAGVWTIVAVAGQTQEHQVNLDGLACRDRAIDRATTVPKRYRRRIRGSVRRIGATIPAAKIHRSAAALARTFFCPNHARPWQLRQSKRAGLGDYDGHGRPSPTGRRRMLRRN